ncbi:MAG: hypothetical protein DMD62_12305 [Gemmatimonadetes bacterium]|nr:MAG: hypothetical protein DMD62_12305 [Gemmatimonadota bacterium]
MRVSDTDSVPLYPWMWKALHKATDDEKSSFALLDDAAVLARLSSHNIEPVAAYFDNKHHEVAHLAFYDDQMTGLSAVGQELGAAFLIRARLVANEARVRHYREKRGPLGLRIEGNFSDVVRTMSVELTVYDVAANRVAFTRAFSSTDTSGAGKADDRVSERIAAGILLALAAPQTAQSGDGAGADSAVATLERTATVEAVVTSNGGTVKTAVPSYRVTLQRIVLVGNLLRFDMALWNTTEEDVRAVLRRDPRNELEAYIVDSLSIRTQAVSTSLANTMLQARPGEKVAFYIVFPVPGTNLKRVSVASLWFLRSPSETQAVSVTVANVALP